MSKKHIFLSIFSKITIFACVFCAFPAWSDTTCNTNFTPIMGNSIQNGTPTPTNPVAIESIGTKIGNKYQISVTTQGNLFDKSTLNAGGFLQQDGSLYSSGNWSYSDYIPVKPNTTYTVSGMGVTASTGAYNCYYNSSKQLISGGYSIATLSSNFTFTTPNNQEVAYIRVNMRTGNTPNPKDTYQLEKGSVATSYAPYSAPITTNVYLDEPLRKVGDYADVLDYKNGTITRNVGVKVLDGTEDWKFSNGAVYAGILYNGVPRVGFCSHFKFNAGHAVLADMANNECIFNYAASSGLTTGNVSVKSSQFTSKTDYVNFIRTQYANGTPVTVYYPLATPVVEQIENWSCTPPITDIQIATTKMVDDEFAQAEANLATTVQTIESVVSRTIAQTGQIQVLQDTKQTRPDESCPANMKCLLVQDEDGTPHWYPIIEP